MGALLFEGWAQPHAASRAKASQELRFGVGCVVIDKKVRCVHGFAPVMIRDMYHHVS